MTVRLTPSRMLGPKTRSVHWCKLTRSLATGGVKSPSTLRGGARTPSKTTGAFTVIVSCPEQSYACVFFLSSHPDLRLAQSTLLRLHPDDRNTTLRRKVEGNQASTALRSYMQRLGLIAPGEPHPADASCSSSLRRGDRPALSNAADEPSVSSDSHVMNHQCGASATDNNNPPKSCGKRRSETLASCLDGAMRPCGRFSHPPSSSSEGPHTSAVAPIASESLKQQSAFIPNLGQAPYPALFGPFSPFFDPSINYSLGIRHHKTLWDLCPGLDQCLIPSGMMHLIQGVYGHPAMPLMTAGGHITCLPSVLSQIWGADERCSPQPDSDSAGESSSSQHHTEWGAAMGFSLNSQSGLGDEPQGHPKQCVPRDTSVSDEPVAGAAEEALAAQALLALTHSSMMTQQQ